MKISGFQQEKVLGEGSYGKVYKAKRLSDNQIYALKVIDLSKLTFREIEDAVNEIRLMASVVSPFIISFYEAFAAEDQKRLCIVTEYAKLGDLSHLIERRKRKNRPLQENQIWQFLLEILEGLRILHSCGVVHRDLKSANILLSAPDLVKIGDLGIATVLHNHKSAFAAKEMARTQIGTPLYIAPEVWKQCPYDQKCDIWSLGVLLFEMMTFNFPFLGRNQDDLQRRVCAGAYTVPKYVEKMYSRELISVLRRLLMVNPKDRPSVDELLDMQSVKSHMDLLNPFLQSELYRKTSVNEISMEGGHAKLLSTIHVPKANYDKYGRKNVNLDNVHLPSQKYDKRPPVIKPIEERMRMKKGAPIPSSLDLGTISTPDLALIADHDWWTPTKAKNTSFSSNADELNSNKDNQQNNTYPPSNSPSKKQQKQVQFENMNQQQNADLQNQMKHENKNPNNEVSFMSPAKPSPRKPLPPIDDLYNQPPNIQIHQQQLQPMDDQIYQRPAQQKISPRMIPSRYKNLYKPCQDNKYQDPRWRRRQPSPQPQKQQTIYNNNNNNNIFEKQQENVPWWYGQELQQQPLQPLPIQQRKHPVVAINPRFRRIGKY